MTWYVKHTTAVSKQLETLHQTASLHHSASKLQIKQTTAMRTAPLYDYDASVRAAQLNMDI